MKTTVTVTNPGQPWFPAIGEYVWYQTKSMNRAKVAHRVDTPDSFNKLRFAFVDGGDTCVGSEQAINKAINSGRMSAYAGDINVKQYN